MFIMKTLYQIMAKDDIGNQTRDTDDIGPLHDIL